MEGGMGRGVAHNFRACLSSDRKWNESCSVSVAEKWLTPKRFLSPCPCKLCPCFSPQWIVVWTHFALPGSTISTHANSCLNTFCLAWQYYLHTCKQLFEHILPYLATQPPHMQTCLHLCSLLFLDYSLAVFCSLITALHIFVDSCSE